MDKEVIQVEIFLERTEYFAAVAADNMVCIESDNIFRLGVDCLNFAFRADADEPFWKAFQNETIAFFEKVIEVAYQRIEAFAKVAQFVWIGDAHLHGKVAVCHLLRAFGEGANGADDIGGKPDAKEKGDYAGDKIGNEDKVCCFFERLFVQDKFYFIHQIHDDFITDYPRCEGDENHEGGDGYDQSNSGVFFFSYFQLRKRESHCFSVPRHLIVERSINVPLIILIWSILNFFSTIPAPSL